VLGKDSLGRDIARAGDYVYGWGDWWRDDLAALAKLSPGNPVHLVCKKTWITFAGFVPNEYKERQRQ
jgi:hypothetical protein